MKLPAVIVAVALAAAACTGAGEPVSSRSGSAIARGGTLHVRSLASNEWLDPASYDYTSFELFRCCLARTLLSYNGRSTDEGGSVLQPDLATGMPVVSPDQLIWTFHLHSGLHYGPPFEDTEIVAADIVRALAREADPNLGVRITGGPSYASYYSVIRGYDAFVRGKTSRISGLQAKDDHTLVVLLTQPTGDLGYRLALPAASPIPPGALDGHERNLEGFWVSSGPYMFEGSGDLDFSKQAKDQTPARGLVRVGVTHTSYRGGSATLVRNPEWDPAADDLRRAYVDRIVVDLLPPGTVDKTTYFSTGVAEAMDGALHEIRRGTLDLVIDANPSPEAVGRFRSDPKFPGLVRSDPVQDTHFIAMNVAEPPFDDIGVRKAFYLALDRVALQRRWTELPGGPTFGRIPSHLFPDATENALLLTYHPRWVPDDASKDLSAARAEMRSSPYDRNGDGRCDVSACFSVGLIADDRWPRAFDRPVIGSEAAIGIAVRIYRYGFGDEYNAESQPEHHWALDANRWAADYPNGSNFAGFFHGPSNFSVLGATHADLRRWDYSVGHVPSVDDRIDRCTSSSQNQVDCWAGVDRYLMDRVVPWVPFLFGSSVRIVSSRIARFSFDQFTGWPALDQIALRPGSP